MKDGFLRVAVATPSIRVADCDYNLQQIVSQIREAPADTALLVFPELCLTGYTCGDLFLQPTLLKSAEQALVRLLASTVDQTALILVGLPVAIGTSVYNCAAVCHQGRLLGLIPKSNIPNYAEYTEARRFVPGHSTVQTVRFAEQSTLFGARQLFSCRTMPSFCLGVEICEDLYVSHSPSTLLATAGATVLANLSASDEHIDRAAFRRNMVSSASAKCKVAYLYASAGEGESSTDLVFSGHRMIVENGRILCEGKRFTTGILSTELDLERILYDRRRIPVAPNGEAVSVTEFDLPITPLVLTRPFHPLPFIPLQEEACRERCEEVLTIQACGLAERMRYTNACAVLGLSGGLDSALALLATLRAFDRIGKDRTEIHAITMPCYGTTGRTKGNALSLAAAAGCTLHEIDIQAAVTRHLQDIGHDGAPDTAYENAQARERTQVLMDFANRCGGLVIGTGDLSELALGWTTYNGDHMSMYGVNAGVPKTLVRYLVAYEAERLGGAYQEALQDILDTPISPELLPPQEGQIAQETEALVGPYELHDFFLYYTLRCGFPPAKIERVAQIAFAERYTPQEIRHWLQIFIRRFFSQQFKRSCLPDGPRIGSVALSPRGDWQVPSDALSTAWLSDFVQ